MQLKMTKEASIRHLQQSAAKGMKGAMLLLAYSHQEGYGTKQDYRKAAHWYSKAIEKEEPLGLLFLGRLYQHGQGVKQDGKKATILFRKAFKIGVAAAYHLGNLYEYGSGNLRRNKRLAICWYEIAARQDGYGSKLAQERLAEVMKQPH